MCYLHLALSVCASSCSSQCDPGELVVMDEVEYLIVRKNNKLAADDVTKLSRGTIPSEVRNGDI